MLVSPQPEYFEDDFWYVEGVVCISIVKIVNSDHLIHQSTLRCFDIKHITLE